MKKLLALVTLVAALSLGGMLIGCDDEYGTYEGDIAFGSLGSASELEGTTVIVSFFADEGGRTWDVNNAKDQQTASDMLDYLGIATGWISKNAAKYGCNADFVYDWTEDEDLQHTPALDGDLTDENECDGLSWSYIDENVDSQALMDRYDAQNVIYMFFLDTKKSLDLTSCTRNWSEDEEYPYEVVYIYSHCDGYEENPSSIAHEILHCFGAPDLYMVDTDGDNYGISQKFVDYCDRNYLDDVMYDVFDPKTGLPLYDRINNKFTELDAYYVGIAPSSKIAEKWGFDKSQHA